jgi:phosphohistidine phosphatase SixA
MRHGKATGLEMESPLLKESIKAMQDPKFIEQVLRINADIIYVSPATRTLQTAEEVQKIMKIYRNKDIEIKTEEKLRSGESMDTIGIYKQLIKT